MNYLTATLLIGMGFYSGIEQNDWTRCIACLGWAAAIVNRAELEKLKKELGR